MKNVLLEYLSKLVSFQSVSGKSQEIDNLFNWVIDEIPEGLKYERLIYNGVKSLIIFYGNKHNIDLLLQAHVDVVDASKKMFSLNYKDNIVIGRGVSDMKFAVAIYLKLLKEFVRDNINVNLAILLTSDEEVGGFDGVASFLKEYDWKPKFVFLPDGGNDFKITKVEKGIIQLKVTSIGKSAHSAWKWKGKNASIGLFNFGLALSKNLDENKLEGVTVNIGKISGGNATNQVMDLAEAFIDIRFPPTRALKEIKNFILNIAKKNSVSVDFLIADPPLKLDLSNPYVLAMQRVLKKHNYPIDYEYDPGASDARHFARYNIPVLMIKPNTGGEHSENEWLDINSLTNYYDIVKEWILAVGKTS